MAETPRKVAPALCVKQGIHTIGKGHRGQSRVDFFLKGVPKREKVPAREDEAHDLGLWKSKAR